ncbi:MAG: uncharacterized protein K0S61_4091 [Anaerocolumna sp.]|nr:uncharacterized protein [Anaerocolumna sp.]
MKWYKSIECGNTVRIPFVCDSGNLEEEGYDHFFFKQGNYIADWNDKLFLKASEKRNNGNPDDALQNYMMLPIYSSRLIKELERAEIGGIQYLPIKILRIDNQTIDNFCIANFLNFIEAFDEENSKFVRFKDDFPNEKVRGKIAGVTKFVLKKEKLTGLDVIRLKEHRQSFFVSEKFKNVFEMNKFTGYEFKEVELV